MRLLIWGLLVTLLPACTTSVKNLAYLHNPETEVYRGGPEPGEYRVRSNDNLYIRVIGEDELMTAFLNITGQGSGINMGMVVMGRITWISSLT